MGIWFSVEFALLAILSVWMTSNAFRALRGRRERAEDMNNLYEQVLGAVRTGDFPRAILILEGEEGQLAILMASILTEATKFAPKLRVAYKITLESLRRQSQLTTGPLRFSAIVSPLIGILGFLGPLISLIRGTPPMWAHALVLLGVSFVIGVTSHAILLISEKQNREGLIASGDLGRKLLNYLVSRESPLAKLRGDTFA